MSFQRNRTSHNWKIVCNQTEAETLKYKLSLEMSDDPSPFSNLQIYKNPDTASAVIYCYFNVDGTNDTKIRKSAEFIRKKIDYNCVINCFELDEHAGKREFRFIHTPKGELFKSKGGDLELIPLDSTAPSDVSTCMTVLESDKATLRPGQLPSEVTDQEYIYLPSTEKGIANIKNEKCGKWMIYTPRRSNMERLDDIFLAMVKLYQNGIFMGLKAATARPSEAEKVSKNIRNGGQEFAMVFCYTADSEDREDVYRAAQAIRSVLIIPNIIYYKTNFASIAGKYLHEGKTQVTKYMHTAGGGFYKRDYLNRYELVF